MKNLSHHRRAPASSVSSAFCALAVIPAALAVTAVLYSAGAAKCALSSSLFRFKQA